MASPSCWLLKSEPDKHLVKGFDTSYAFERFEHEPEQTALYTGVRNLQARGFIRDRMKVGDRVLFYHSSCKVPGVAGICEVARPPEPDVEAMDPAAPFYDEKHTSDSPRWWRVWLRAVRPVHRFVSLTELRAAAAADSSSPLNGMTLLRQPRLSVQPVTDAQWQAVLALEGVPAATSAATADTSAAPAAVAKTSRAVGKRGRAAKESEDLEDDAAAGHDSTNSKGATPKQRKRARSERA